MSANIQRSIAKSTWLSYMSSWMLQLSFLGANDLDLSSFSEQIVLLFLNSLMAKCYSWSHINTILAGVSFFLRVHSLPTC